MLNETNELPEVGKKQAAAVHRNDEPFMKSVVEFLFASEYDVLTWILIALCAGTVLLFVDKENWRAVMWSVVALIVCGLVMIALQADRHFFRNRSQAVVTPTLTTGLSEAVRPYVFLWPPILGSSSLNSVTPIFVVTNKGATPARNISIIGEIMYPEPTRRTQPDVAEMYNTGHVGFLGSGDEITVENIPDLTVLDKTLLQEIKRGKRILVIRMSINYEDLEGGSYQEKDECFEYNRKLNKDHPDEFSPCRSGLARQKAKAHDVETH